MPLFHCWICPSYGFSQGIQGLLLNAYFRSSLSKLKLFVFFCNDYVLFFFPQKRAKLEAKLEKKKAREAEEQMREMKKKKEDEMEQERKKIEEKQEV